jgi:hypothetical protein
MSDRGSAPIELAAGFGLLVLPIAVAILVAPGWLAARNTAEAAAHAGASAIASGPNDVAAESTALNLAEEIAAQRGVELESVEFCPPRGSCFPLARGAVVEVVVSVRADSVDLPGLTSLAGVIVEKAARASVDPYRSLP